MLCGDRWWLVVVNGGWRWLAVTDMVVGGGLVGFGLT